MKQIFKISLLAAFVLAFSGCEVEDTINIDLPMGVKTLEVGLAVQYPEGETTATGEVAAAKDYTITIDDDQMFPALKYYKNDEITELSVKNVYMKLWNQTNQGEVHDFQIVASVGGVEMARYENPLIEALDEAITGDDALAAFMETVILEAVSGKSVLLKYTGTYITDQVYTGGAWTAFNVTIRQEMDARITVRR